MIYAVFVPPGGGDLISTTDAWARKRSDGRQTLTKMRQPNSLWPILNYFDLFCALSCSRPSIRRSLRALVAGMTMTPRPPRRAGKRMAWRPNATSASRKWGADAPRQSPFFEHTTQRLPSMDAIAGGGLQQGGEEGQTFCEACS